MTPARLAVSVQNASRLDSVPPAAQLKRWAARALANRARAGALTIRVVTAAESAALNERYRGKKGPTNVLAFPSDAPPGVDAGELLPLGDLVICADVVAREASEQGKPLAAHWAHIVIHGALHLAGFDHESTRDAAAMEARERTLLAELGFADPYAA